MKKILVINPGSTSTKVAVYHDLSQVFSSTIAHRRETLATFHDVHDQYEFRHRLVLSELETNHIPLDFDVIISRGGIGRPVEGGAMVIDEQMIADNLASSHRHACNLACKIAYDIAATLPGCIAITADPGVVDELSPEAHLTGLPEIRRECIWHALNQRAVARRYARNIGQRYADLNLIIGHLGGGISVAAHDHGRAIDVNNALDGEGPFSTDRAGSLPCNKLIRLCFSGKYTEPQLLRMLAGNGGMMAYLGTNDLREVIRMMDQGNEQAALLFRAMAYNISKQIGAQAAALCGKVDAILLTGGMAHSEQLVDLIRQRVDFIAPVRVYPGEDEMSALAEVAYEVLRGNMTARAYDPREPE